MTDKFQRLYNATPFDPAERQDQIGETARRAVITAAVDTDATMGIRQGQDMPYLLGGLLVGVVQIIQATASSANGMSRDEIDASIRASIMEIAPWAVDMSRAQQGKEPLANV